MSRAKAEAVGIWDGDLLDREKDAIYLEKFLVARVDERKSIGSKGSLVLNVDAEWGAGKTFFLDRFALQLKKSRYIVATVNAWRDDHMDDPFVSILAAIDAALEPFTKRPGKAERMWQSVKDSATPIMGRALAGFAKTIVKRYTGASIEALIGDSDEAATDGGSVLSVDETAPPDGTLLENALASAATIVAVEIEKVVDKKAEELIEAFRKKSDAVDNFRSGLRKGLES